MRPSHCPWVESDRFWHGHQRNLAARLPRENGPQATRQPTREETGGIDPRYRTCAEANAQGLGPYVKGQDPEYEWYQDRDGDGRVWAALGLLFVVF
ncbi:excalibur calcium-binding domain-containing protein [Nonomuraea polychroma]|uniref:excalibur calcium-binding domain-containing protein n=1 Tax=Nonomuraea polychroma TaxID=46176 RepID=UPI000FDF2FA3